MTESRLDQEPLLKKLKEDNCNNDVDNNKSIINAELLRKANEALQESNRLHVKPSFEETKLGIELFIGDRSEEFHGLIKTRYADFIVHEIDVEGNKAQLTILDPPDEQEVPVDVDISKFVDDKALECITEVNNGYLNEYRIDVTGMDKDTRTSLHQALRSTFDRIESSTLTDYEIAAKEKKSADKEIENTSKPQQVAKSESNNNEQPEKLGDKKYIILTRRNRVSRPKNVWPRDRPDHTHFILYKENKDTMDAIHNLAAAINARPANFCSAGVKDRRAVTTQWLSSWRLEPKRLIAASRRFNKRPFIKVGNFCFKKDPLRLGQLKANRFDIVIRHLVYNSVKTIESAIDLTKQKGFVNYFGLQRFGTRSIQTHEIGLAILQSKWEKAVDLILSYRFDDGLQQTQTKTENSTSDNMGENELSSQNSNGQKLDSNKTTTRRWANGAEQHNAFIDLWKSKLDAELVFKKYPHFRFTNEGIIMKSLSKSEESNREFMNALISLPRNTRSMYVHSYQSLLWNKMTTYRLKTYGYNVVPGDLVLSKDKEVSDNSLELLLSIEEVEPIEDTSAKNSARKVPFEELDSKIIVATEEDCKNYSIFDVVLPIVGSRVRLPQNGVREELDRLLEEDNLTVDSFKAQEKLFISYGSYRKIMVKPDNVTWRLEQYSHPQQNLVETDLDKLNRGISIKDNVDKIPEKPGTTIISDSTDEALIVSFELPPSAYATMCLREIMKKPSTDFNNKF